MKEYAVPSLWIYFSLGFLILFMIAALWLLYLYWKTRNSDIVLLIDKNNRWLIIYTPIAGKQTLTIGGKTYYFSENCGLLSKKGKALYIFAENKPAPMDIKYNSSVWLDSKSLTGIINNKLVQQIVKPADAVKDMLIIIGAIASIIAMISATISLLISTGVIKPK